MDTKHVIETKHVDDAISERYSKLTTRIGAITIAFPVVLIVVGWCWGISIQPTLSDYYYATEPVGHRIDAFPVRLWFCGILFAVGVFLFRYRGFSRNEDRWLSLASTFALGVAIFPTSFNGKSDYPLFDKLGLPWLSLHGLSAVLAFLSIAVVIFWYADSTLSKLKKSNPTAYKVLKTAYALIGAYMAVSIGITVALHYLNGKQGIYILLAEWSGLWAFGAYWFFKKYELKKVAEEMKRNPDAAAATTMQKTKADVAEVL
jgi:succinate dehydrogenase/fumarate reductase cytochrome b subunit